MGALLTATIRPALVPIFDAIQSNAPGANDLCVTLQAADNDKAWVQVVSNTINFGYTRSEDPLAFLTKQGVEALPETKVMCWEKGLVATLSHASLDSDVVAVFVDGIFTSVFGCGDDTVIETKFEQL